MAKQKRSDTSPRLIQVTIDMEKFVATRDSLISSYVSASDAMDKMAKAYLAHTEVVLAGNEALNVSFLLAPFQEQKERMIEYFEKMSAGMPVLYTAGAGAAEVGDATAKRKRRQYVRDPNAPKRPLTAYFRFLAENRHKIADEVQAHPENFDAKDSSKPGDLSKIVTERWNGMSSEEQEPYREMYRKDLQAYEKEMALYKANGGGAANPANPSLIAVAADDDDDASTTSSDSDSDSREDRFEEPLEAPIREPTPPPPAAIKRTTKPGPKTGPAKKVFSSIPAAEPVVSAPATAPALEVVETPKTSGSARKRRAAAMTVPEPEEPSTKKRSRKSKADAQPATPAPASTTTVTAAPVSTAPAVATTPANAETNGGKKKRKDKKEERKDEKEKKERKKKTT